MTYQSSQSDALPHRRASATPPGSLSPFSESAGSSGPGVSFWTEENIAHLTRLWSQDMSASRIGQVLGCSRNAVIGKAHRLGLAKRPSPIISKYTPEERAARREEKKRRAAERARRNQERLLAGGVLMKDLTETTCRFPIGHPDEPGFHFCGADSPIDRTYCEFHHAKCFKKESPGQGLQGEEHRRKAIEALG